MNPHYKTCLKRNLILAISFLLGGNVIAQKFISASLFAVDSSKPSYSKMLRKRTTLTISPKELSRIFATKPPELELKIPFEGKLISLELERYNPLSNNFQVMVSTSTGTDKFYPFEEGVFYRGKVLNERKSFVAVSFLQDGFTALLADEKSNITIGISGEDFSPDSGYVIYRNTDVTDPFTMNCVSDAVANLVIAQQRPAQALTTTTIGCPVDIYVEADHALYVANGSDVKKTVNFVATVMNGVSAVYLNENITLQLREVKVWTTTDPYAGTNDAKTVLKAFEVNMSGGYNGDLAQLLSSRKMNGGVNGIAPVDVLCKSNPGDRCSFVGSLNVGSPASDINTYLAAHELGHNFGSLHTQNCSWAGGALDNCVAPEGTCAPGPSPTNGGTIMSYCSVNLANGFGKQPGDLIRTKLANAPCVCNCNNIEVSATSGTVICGSNGSATAAISGFTGSPSYLWDNGESTSTAVKLSAGWHYVTVSSAGTPACKVIKGVKVSGTVSPAPAKPVITNNNNVLVSSVQTGNQWYFNGNPISGATGKTFTPTANGVYTVRVNLNGCVGISNDFQFLGQPGSGGDISVYPNPVDQNLTISNANTRPLAIQVINMLGQTMATITSNAGVIPLNMSRYAAGAYILLIIDTGSDERFKEVVIKY
jgi:hypothetical protein